MRRTKAEMMSGVDATRDQLVAHNTVEYWRPNGTRVIRYHLTDILEFAPDGTITFNTDGWQTVTTKARLNHFQKEIRVYQKDFKWFAMDQVNQHVKFFDGLQAKDGKIILRSSFLSRPK